MKSKKVIFSFILFFLFIVISNVCMAKELDRINQYYITVDLRKDGSLDMTYSIKWEVLDSDSEGPLEWVKIGIPNSNVDSIKAVSSNIKSVKYYEDSGDYIRIDFEKAYYEGEVIDFTFSFHQDYMYTIDGKEVTYEFTPGWFSDIKVEDLRIFWNAEDVVSASSKTVNSDNYYTWETSLSKGKKYTVTVTYDRYSRSFAEGKQTTFGTVASTKSSSSSSYNSTKVITSIIAFIIIFSLIMSVLSPNSYRRHGGYGYRDYDRPYHHDRPSCASSCACVSSCACACACAGGGRAGCSKKDFYGVTIRTKRLNKVIDEDLKRK